MLLVMNFITWFFKFFSIHLVHVHCILSVILYKNVFLFCWVFGLKDELEKISRLFQYYKFNRILIMYDKNEKFKIGMGSFDAVFCYSELLWKYWSIKWA